jgi:polyvinyl alcohol dehydrogenase (cytochrome)
MAQRSNVRAQFVGMTSSETGKSPTMKRYLLISLGTAFAASLLLVSPAQVRARAQKPPLGTEMGYEVFQKNCMTCHGNPDSPAHAPEVSTLRQMSPEAIYTAITTGPMAVQAQKLTDEEKVRVAEALSSRPLGAGEAGDAKTMPNRCESNPPMSDPSSGPAWNGWGVDIINSRYQESKAAGISPDQVPHLKLKWAFGYPNGVSAWGQPAIVAGRVFVSSDIGYVYSLDAATGCVHWSFQAKGSMRNAVSVGPVKGQGTAKYAVYFGDMKGNVYAVNASTGELLWTTPAETHYTSRITGAPKLYDGRLYVPVSSWEEFSASSADYPCCTFRGSVVAFDANTGRQVWKTYTIPEEAKPTRKNSKGMQLYAPAGASVWNSPTIDVKRRAIYFGTGDSETEPAGKESDAMMALNMDTGKLLWTFQDTKNDAYLRNCDTDNPPENCPKDLGPDWDMSATSILRTLPNGKRVLVAAAKSGNIFGLDPDRNGALLWKVSLAKERPGSGGLLRWGGAADEQNVYFGLLTGGMVALRLADGGRVWFTPLVSPHSDLPGFPGQSAVASVISGVAFVGGMDGRLLALSTEDGHVIWQYETAREFTTVNGVAAKGGTFGAPGPTIAGGMLFANSGYAFFTGVKPGNVLLAFSVE